MSVTSGTYNYNSSLVLDYNTTFTLFTPIGATAQANVYEDMYKTLATNYVIFLNVGSYGSLFSHKTYEDFINQVNQNVIVNTTYLQTVLNSPASSVVFRGLHGANDAVTGLENVTNDNGNYSSGVKNYGFRLLELAALNIFSSATARAAIANDTEFIYGDGTNLYTGQGETSGTGTLYSSLANQINYAFNVESNNIFNQYVNTWRYIGSNDVNQYVPYNFTSTNFQILMTYQVNTYGINRGVGYTGSVGGFYPNGFNKTILLVLSDSYNIGDIITKYNILV
jgi:hypothetical protein